MRRFRPGEFVWVRSPKADHPDEVMIPVRVLPPRWSGALVWVMLPTGIVACAHWRRLRRISVDEAEREFILRRVAG